MQTQEMTVLGNTRKPDLVFYKSGRIDIMARVSRMIGLEPGDVIDLAPMGSEVYLYVAHKGANVIGRHEAVCRSTKGKSCNMRCHSKRLSEFVLERHPGKEMVRLPVGAPIHHQQLGTALPVIIKRAL